MPKFNEEMAIAHGSGGYAKLGRGRSKSFDDSDAAYT
jgi:hypothetical protein